MAIEIIFSTYGLNTDQNNSEYGHFLHSFNNGGITSENVEVL